MISMFSYRALVPLKESTGRTLAQRLNCFLKLTLIEVNPSPTGVVKGPFSVMRFLAIKSNVF